MPYLKRFSTGDIQDSVLNVFPRYRLFSGSNGWSGSPEISASLSLRGKVTSSPSRVITGVTYGSNSAPQFGVSEPFLSTPITASVHVVRLRNVDLSPLEQDQNNWGDDHWTAISRVYDMNSRENPVYSEEIDGSYSVFFQRDSKNIVAFPGAFSRFSLPSQVPTGSWTFEIWMNPYTSIYPGHNFTIASANRIFWIGLTGSTGDLIFSSSFGSFSSSLQPEVGRWSHVAVRYDGSSGSFSVNLRDGGNFSHPPLIIPNSFTASLSIGQVVSSSMSFEFNDDTRGLPNRSFHGTIGEFRFWPEFRTDEELADNWDSRLDFESARSTIISSWMTEGPQVNFYRDVVPSFPHFGSGTMVIGKDYFFDNPSFEGGEYHGFLLSFDDRLGPAWVPNDNPNLIREHQTTEEMISFFYEKSDQQYEPFFAESPLEEYLLVNIPSAFHGDKVVPGSLRLTCNAYSQDGWKLQRIIADDNRGSLYISGSLCSGSSNPDTVSWRRVGSIFYPEGLIVIKDPSLIDFGTIGGASSDVDRTFILEFEGQSFIPTKTINCRIEPGEFNCSSNPTFSGLDPEDGVRIRRSGQVPYISTVGIYDSQRKLLGVARLADPVRINGKNQFCIRIKVDM